MKAAAKPQSKAAPRSVAKAASKKPTSKQVSVSRDPKMKRILERVKNVDQAYVEAVVKAMGRE